MAIKNILLPADHAEIDEPVLALVLAVARRFDAHIDVLYIHPDPGHALPAMIEHDVYGSFRVSPRLRDTLTQAAEQEFAERMQRMRKTFDSFCRKRKLSTARKPASRSAPSAVWEEVVGWETDVIRRRGRLADLIVLRRPVRESPAPIVLETALLETSRPILVVPPKVPKNLGNRIVVCWDGSAEAAHAVAAAEPFLDQAKKVVAVTLEEGADMASTAEHLARLLAWHGIKAKAEVIKAGRRSVGQALLAEADRQDADLLVMGGYGHSRTRELVLGGATRHVLAKAEIPVLMVH